jgi:LuxR family maltose regulon positive regulatory protein
MMARKALRETVLRSLERHPLNLIIAPPISGKATLVGQIIADLRVAGTAINPSLTGAAGGVTVLERIDRLNTQARAEAMAAITRQMAAGGRILITSEQPMGEDFALARLRGQVGEVGPRALALTADEIPAFLGDALADSRVNRPVRALLDRTEGWIAAWNVLRARLESGSPLADLAAEFGGADHDIAQYFDRHVMAPCDPATRLFLLAVGPLERVSADLAEAITGQGHGQALLERASRQCAFFLPDRGYEWRRPHRLFRDYLRHRGQRDDPANYRRNLERAARWFSARADWLAAAQLFLDAGQPEEATEILSRHTEELITAKGEINAYRRLATSLSRSGHQAPALASELALGSIFSGDFAGAAALLDRLTPQIDTLPEKARSRLEAMRINVDFGFERFDHVMAVAPRWLDQRAGFDPRFRAIVAQCLFWSCLAQLDTVGADRAIAIARTETVKAASPFLDGWLSVAGGIQKWDQGQIIGAEIELGVGASDGVIGHTANLVRAAIAWECGRRARARQLISESLTEGTRHSVVETSLLGWETAARLEIEDAGLASGLDLLREAEFVVAARHGERARRMMRLLRGTLILQSHDQMRGADLGVELGAINDEAGSRRHSRSLTETARITLARYQALNGRPRDAISLLQPILGLARRQNRLGVMVEAAMIHAGALARLDETERAARVAWQAAESVAGGGMGAAIWDEVVLLAPLTDDLVARAAMGGRGEARGAASIILALATRAGRRPLEDSDDPPLIAEPTQTIRYTDMERRILLLVAQGLSNLHVAERLLIRESTVKWHMHNIFGKLSVRSRTAALAESRRLGLIG